jgi:hypothetical protein
LPGDPRSIATNMTLLPDAPAVHGPFVLRFSRHLSWLLLMGLGSYRRLGAVLPLFPGLPLRDGPGNQGIVKRARTLEAPAR